MEDKKIKFETIEPVNEEMRQLLKLFTVERSKDVQQTLTQLETNVTAIRSHLERKSKKTSLIQVDKKLDIILNTLIQNGFTLYET